MNILKRKFWSARWQWCFNLWFLQTYVKNDSYLKKPDDLLLADMLSKPVIKWLKSAVRFLITLAVFASSSYFGKKIKVNFCFELDFGKKITWLLLNATASSILPSSCKMICFSSTRPTPFFLTYWKNELLISLVSNLIGTMWIEIFATFLKKISAIFKKLTLFLTSFLNSQSKLRVIINTASYLNTSSAKHGRLIV